ncbi:uncharacterized protein [Zea mays]|jgi:hypothetical protein|uniref:Uncharacterized protein n=1 Tax=Zea mays TaxID=4577 RepID=K7VAJ2_MAIZE|nr:uncharacterized protein LOC103634839 [Zea mays]AQK90356.1 hypothetical protein ZEAMMB73_Zm00001d008650 [Zea mays]|eukprot:XP_008655647.1 uncharacterized protein LOC103634839 [Zea mays]
MEKAAGVSAARLAVAAAAVLLCLLLLLAAGPQGVSGADGRRKTASPYDKLISCRVLGNCDKNKGPEATRPGKPVNKYTRGCSKIDKCRD